MSLYRSLSLAIALGLGLGSSTYAASTSSLSNNRIKQLIIQQSIAAYSGNCPCPYSTAANGSRCGKRSAWSRPGGEEPICFKDDVTEEMIKEWRSSHR
ncbi:hypothetical protein [Biostraticola tofi]|uniref:Uncharacterized protein n=1 Tax=Biostraticola tofi TaxID=466109 RepID=A0A4R3YYA3_9GAMM|nr:hypothetical protein [Biostraticola tofi]TCV98217.1 hypothetical protein EDC52_103308 [Biostraticola tofi]